MSKKELSILMPSFNNVCVDLVRVISEQCSNIEGLHYEVIVADDGSTDRQAVLRNREINGWDDCRYIEREFNAGRAAIRNFLVKEARYERIIFMDSDVRVDKDDFIADYLEARCNGVVYGAIHNDRAAYDAHNLRCVYECAFELNNPASVRNTKPYQQFRTTNFMAPRSVMLRFPFDESFREYGYEDVLFGRALKENGIPILHIDNPVVVDDYDTNAEFIDKTQQALRTLHAHRAEMNGYSGILTAARILHRCMMYPAVRCMFRMTGKSVYRNLCSNNPRKFLFNVYRIMYYISIR